MAVRISSAYCSRGTDAATSTSLLPMLRPRCCSSEARHAESEAFPAANSRRVRARAVAAEAGGAFHGACDDDNGESSAGRWSVGVGTFTSLRAS